MATGEVATNSDSTNVPQQPDNPACYHANSANLHPATAGMTRAVRLT
jgi:hypothetical protein